MSRRRPEAFNEPAELCVLCRSRDQVDYVHLSFGAMVALCKRHASNEYLTRDAGRTFTRRLSETWQAAGVLNATRLRVLISHIRRVRNASRAKELPGSHAWQPERHECEQRFASGEDLAQVIASVRDPGRWGGRKPPSVRTIRRWYSDGRWLKPPASVLRHLKIIGQATMDMLALAYEVGSIHSWHEWISIRGEMPIGEQRLRRNLGWE